MKHPSFSRCCEDSVNVEDGKPCCELCGQELNEKGFPVDKPRVLAGQCWMSYGDRQRPVPVIRVEDWVNRSNPQDTGTTVWYMLGNKLKSKDFESFLQNYFLP